MTPPASRPPAAGAGGVKTQRARWVLGIVAGGGVAFGIVAAVLIVLASNSGAGHEGRHRLAARLAWIRSGEWRRAPMIDANAILADNKRV